MSMFPRPAPGVDRIQSAFAFASCGTTTLAHAAAEITAAFAEARERGIGFDHLEPGIKRWHAQLIDDLRRAAEGNEGIKAALLLVGVELRDNVERAAEELRAGSKPKRHLHSVKGD